jgi:serine O-acetyltransferase
MLRVVSRLLDRQNRLEERLRSMQKALPGPEGERLMAQMEREEVDMVLTAQVCPMVSHLIEQVRRRMEGLPGIDQVEVKVLDEPWN